MIKLSKKKITSILCSLAVATSIGTPIIQIANASSDDSCDYKCQEARRIEWERQEHERKVKEMENYYRPVMENSLGEDAKKNDSTLRNVAEYALKYGVEAGTNYLGNQMKDLVADHLKKQTVQTAQDVVSEMAGTAGTDAASGASGVAQNSAKGLSPEASMALQAVLGVIGGIPLSQSVSYSPSGSKGTYVCAPMDSNSLNPGVNDTVRYTCTGVAFTGNTVVLPPFQVIEMNPKDGGISSKSISGRTVTYHEDWVEVNSCGASISANVYDGTSTMGEDVFGSFADFEKMIKDIEALGESGQEYLQKMEDYKFSYGGGDTSIDVNSSLSDAIYNSDNKKFDGSGNYNGDYNGGDYSGSTGDYSSGSLNDMYGDGDDSFNSEGADWNSSNSDGNLEGTDTDSYFNSSNNYSIDGVNVGGLTNDILGIGDNTFSTSGYGDNEFNSSNGMDGIDGNVSDLAGLSTTNEAGVPGYYDNQGNFVPYDKDAYKKFQEINAERIKNGQEPLTWAEFMQQYYGGGTNGFGNEYGQTGRNGSSLSSTIESLKDKIASILGGEKVATMTEQQMFDAAKKFLLANGYSLDELLKGANYDGGSVYTEPQYAWDMNRITKLIKLNKIEITDENNKPVQPQNSALGKATMTGSGFLKADQEKRKGTK